MLEGTARDAAVGALDEIAILAADLVVEGHQLVDPLLVDVGAEEVVEEAVRAVGRDRHHRPDRDVRTARKDVHAEIRPQKMELAPRQLAVEMHARAAALPRRAVLARQPPLGRQRVRAGRHVEHRRELRMRDLAVVALEEVLADDLPVRRELRLPAPVEAQRVDVEPELRDLRGHRPERLGEWLRIQPSVDEHERAPRVDRDTTEAEVLLREVRLLIRARRRAQRAVELVRPRVIRALERRALALALGDRETAMPTHVHQRAQLPVAGARHDHRRLPRARREERPRPGQLAQVSDVLPRRAEDPLLLPAQYLRIRVPPIGKRRFDDANLPPL